MLEQPAPITGSARPSRLLILASSSPYRRGLIERFACRFDCRAPEVDETPVAGESAKNLVRRLAVAKARALANDYPDAIVVGSDQLAIINGRQLGKPGSVDRAV